MNFCTKCGTKLKENEATCPNCGYDFQSKEYINKNTSTDNNNFHTSENSSERNLMVSKKFKISIAGIIILIILIGIYIVIGKSITNPANLVSRFQSDVATNNKVDLSKILYCYDDRLRIDDKNSNALLLYFKDNPSNLNKTINDLNNEIINNNSIRYTNNPSQSNLSLVNVGKTLLFFPNYKIAIKPTFIDVKAGIKDVDFSLDGTKIGKSDTDNFSREFGPFVPGEYKLYANYNGKYTSLNKTYNIDLVNSVNGKVSIDTLTNLNYIKIDGDYPDAEIFVNNRDSGVKISDASNFGPVSSDMKIYAVANQNGKKLKSDVYTISDGDTNISLNFSESENQLSNMENQVHDLIYWYTNSFSDAINYNNFSSVQPYVYPGSDLYNEQQKYIPMTYNKGIKENIVSFNVLSYTMSEDNKSGTITTEEVYDITNGGQTSTKTFKYNYTFKYNEDKGNYQLSSLANAN